MSIHLIGEEDANDQRTSLQLARARKKAEATYLDGTTKFRRIIWVPRIIDRSVDDRSPPTIRDPLAILSRFDKQLSTNKVDADILSKFVEFLLQYLGETAPRPDTPAPVPDKKRPSRSRRSPIEANPALSTHEHDVSPPAQGSQGGRYYVSYAWADQSDPKRESAVDALCAEAQKRGVQILRDKDILKQGEQISSFMRQLAKGDRVFIFLSDKYLRSPFCMNELFEMWKNCRQNKDEFLQHVRFYSIDGVKLTKPYEWLEYADYWRREHDMLSKKIKSVGWEFAGEEVRRRVLLMNNFVRQVSDILALFADTVQANTFEDFLKTGFAVDRESR